jgi:hypothetical protein
VCRLALATLTLALGCAPPPAADADAGPQQDDAGAPVVDAGPPPAPIDWDEVPCADDGALWSERVASSAWPVIVHHQRGDADMADQVLALLEHSLDVQVDGLGFSPPPDDEGACGPDGAFDVFLWRSYEESFVDVLDEIPSTPHDDMTAYMVLDPWGPYGGDALRVTVAHELNHALQAADDWGEIEIAYEMTATFIEEVLYPDDDWWHEIVADFQDRPDWSLDRGDDWETWYMYGAALYLLYLREAHFDGDASFIADVWHQLRSTDWRNEPDLVDALDVVLAPARFVDTVAPFAAWRATSDVVPAGAQVPAGGPATTTAGRVALTPAPMLLGSAYLRVAGDAGATFTVALDGDAGARWIVQTIEGEVLDVSSGPASVTLDGAGARTLAVTALPLDADAYETDERSDARFDVALTIATE